MTDQTPRVGKDRAPRDSRNRSLIGRGTDQDLGLKVAVRRLMWRMGCSTRIDVRLRGYVEGDPRGQAAYDFTDLDVLGIGFTPAGQLHTTFADCRTRKDKYVERMFWVRGVADFVAAGDAYMVRSSPVPTATRTLSARLNVGVLAPDDLLALEKTFATEVDLTSGPLATLFTLENVAVHLNIYDTADKKLGKLLDYLNFDYWVYEPYRNLTQLVAQLSGVVAVLDPQNRQHRTLFYDCAWHYALAVSRAVAFTRSSRMGDVPTAVRTYVGGGELALREKAGLATMLKASGFPDVDKSVILPPYINQLTELVNRFLVRPSELADVMRYAEYLAVTEPNRVEATVGVAFGLHVRPVAAKLLADICGFLVTAAGLRPEFRTSARSRLVVDLTGGDPGQASDPRT